MTTTLTLMETLTADGWLIFGPGETVKCPSTFTVRRDDRRGGTLGARQILRRGQPHTWSANEVPPSDERRRLVWPPQGPPSGIGPTQRTCHAIIEENGPESIAGIRPCVVEPLPLPHFTYLATPCGCTTGYRICPTCGVRLELCRIPAELRC